MNADTITRSQYRYLLESGSTNGGPLAWLRLVETVTPGQIEIVQDLAGNRYQARISGDKVTLTQGITTGRKAKANPMQFNLLGCSEADQESMF